MSTELHSEPSKVAALPGRIFEVPEMKKGTEIRLQKIDPKTGDFLPQKTPLQGPLTNDRTDKTEARVKVGQAVYIDIGSDYSPSHCSRIEKITAMSDGSYWLTTIGSTYRLTILSTKEDDAYAPKDAPVSETIINGAKETEMMRGVTHSSVEQTIVNQTKPVRESLFHAMLRYRPW